MSDVIALHREIEAAKLIAEQVRSLSGDDPDFIRDAIEGETNLMEIMSSLVTNDREDHALVGALEDLISRYQERKRRIEGRIETRRALIGTGLEVAERPKLETPAGTVSLAKVAPKVIVQDEALIPSEFWKAADPKLDRKALASALKDKREIPGATLSNGSVTVKIL